MNAHKYIFIVLLAILSMHAAFGQAKDETVAFRTDPAKSIQVYPNPTTEFVIIKFESPTANQSKFTIHNVIGNEIESEPEFIDEYEVRIKVKDLHEGYYFLSVQNVQTSLKTSYKFLKR